MPVNVTGINSVYRDRTPLLFGSTLLFSSTRATGIECISSCEGFALFAPGVGIPLESEIESPQKANYSSITDGQRNSRARTSVEAPALTVTGCPNAS